MSVVTQLLDNVTPHTVRILRCVLCNSVIHCVLSYEENTSLHDACLAGYQKEVSTQLANNERREQVKY